MKAGLKIKNNLVITVNKVLNDEVLVELGNSFKAVCNYLKLVITIYCYFSMVVIQIRLLIEFYAVLHCLTLLVLSLYTDLNIHLNIKVLNFVQKTVKIHILLTSL